MQKYLLYSNWRTSIHTDTTLSLSLPLSYSLIYQGEASPLKGSSRPWVKWWSVSHFLPPPLIFIGQEELPRLPWASPRHQWGGDMWRRGVGANLVNLPREGVASFRADIREYTWHRHWLVTIRPHVEGWCERPQSGFGRPRGSVDPVVVPIALVFVQVTARWVPRLVWRVFALFLAHYLMVLGPWICVLALDWSRMLLWIGEVSWPHGRLCGSTLPRGLVWVPPGAHDVLCISLSSGLWCMQMIYLFQSSRRARRNGANQFWHLRLSMMMPYLCHWFICSQLYNSLCIYMCPATKDRNTNTCRNCQYKPIF
jgi:hypothetical protein